MILTQTSVGAANASLSERGFVGSILMGYAKASDSGLRSEDFTDSLCQRVFATAKSLEAQGKTADLVTVSDVDDAVGDLVELTSEASAYKHIVDQYADNIRAASARREVHGIALNAAKMALDGDVSIDETVSLARAALDAVGASTGKTEAIAGTDAICEFHDWLYDKPENPIPTGIGAIDRRLNGGIIGGKLVVVGARPAVGKSAMLSAIALNALRQGRRVLYVSLEMQPREVVSRMISTLAHVSASKMESHSLSEEEMLKVTDAYGEINGDHLFISTTAVTPAQVRKAALKIKAGGGLDIVCVDYLQLMHAEVGKNKGRTEEVGEISRSLKLLAMELCCPVVAAAQVNRASTHGEDRAPRLSELRESGSIEQDADVVIFLHRPLGGDLPGGACKMQLIIAKNRQGSCDGANMTFWGEYMRFAEVIGGSV